MDAGDEKPTSSPPAGEPMAKRKPLPHLGAAARKCPYTLRSAPQGVSVADGGGGERQAANDAVILLVDMASRGGSCDCRVSSTGRSTSTEHQSMSQSPAPLSLTPQLPTSQGSTTSQTPPPRGPTLQPPPPSTIASTSSSNDAGLARKGRGRRGPTRGLAMQRLQEGQCLDVQVQGGTGVGCYGSDFVTQLGVIARTHCKIWQSNWSKLPLETKEAIFRNLQLKFRFERTPETEKEIIQHMGEMHRKYRGVLKKRFFSGKPFEEAILNVPSGVDPADWQMMCEKWTTSAEQSVANRNKANRAHQTMPYRLGRRNIYQVKEEFRKSQGRDPDRFEIFRLTRSKELPDGSQVWVDGESREKMDEMAQLMGRSFESVGGILTSEQAFIQVMGKDRPGRVRCAGRAETLRKWYGPSEGSSSSSSYQKLLEQNQAQAKKIAEQAEEIRQLKKSLHKDRQQQQIQMRKIQELQMQMQRQMQDMLTCFQSSQASKASLVESEEDEGGDEGNEED